MIDQLDLFEIDEPTPVVPAPRALSPREATYEWLCKRGWTIFGDGQIAEAWVCPVCGQVQANTYLMSINGHLEPEHLLYSGDRWLLTPWDETGCWNRQFRYQQWWGAMRRGEEWPGRFNDDLLPWFPTREAAERAA